MSDPAAAQLRSFYDLMWERRSIDELLAHFRPEATLRDHRHMSSWGGTPQDWRTLIEGWWSLLPDGRVERLESLRTIRTRNAHVVTVAGTDSITGGPAELEFHAVIEMADGLVVACDYFDDEASALEYLDQL